MKPLTERTMQGILMRWLLRDRNHEFVLPGSTDFFGWEADVVSVTKAGLAHEFEIKISAADYRRDFEKKIKHMELKDPLLRYRPHPAYFWYATTGFEIEPPEYAGWIEVTYDKKQYRYIVSERKPAPRLHNVKVTDAQKIQIAHLLSFRLMTEYHGSGYEATA